MTRCEKLQSKIGQKIECELCHQKKPLTFQWKITKDHQLICPGCAGKYEGLQVSI